MNPAEVQSGFSLSAEKRSHDPTVRVFYYTMHNRFIAHASLTVDAKERSIVWDTFCPVGMDGVPTRNGIGTLAHIETMRSLLHDEMIEPSVSEFTVRHRFPALFSLSHSRWKHLRAMNLRPALWTGMPLPEYALRSMKFGETKGFTFPEEELRQVEEQSKQIDENRTMLMKLLGRV